MRMHKAPLVVVEGEGEVPTELAVTEVELEPEPEAWTGEETAVVVVAPVAVVEPESEAVKVGETEETCSTSEFSPQKSANKATDNNRCNRLPVLCTGVCELYRKI